MWVGVHDVVLLRVHVVVWKEEELLEKVHVLPLKRTMQKCEARVLEGKGNDEAEAWRS